MLGVIHWGNSTSLGQPDFPEIVDFSGLLPESKVIQHFYITANARSEDSDADMRPRPPRASSASVERKKLEDQLATFREDVLSMGLGLYSQIEKLKKQLETLSPHPNRPQPIQQPLEEPRVAKQEELHAHNGCKDAQQERSKPKEKSRKAETCLW